MFWLARTCWLMLARVLKRPDHLHQQLLLQGRGCLQPHQHQHCMQSAVPVLLTFGVTLYRICSTNLDSALASSSYNKNEETETLQNSVDSMAHPTSSPTMASTLRPTADPVPQVTTPVVPDEPAGASSGSGFPWWLVIAAATMVVLWKVSRRLS